MKHLLLAVIPLMLSGLAFAGGTIGGGPQSAFWGSRFIVIQSATYEVDPEVFANVANAVARHRQEVYVDEKVGYITPTDMDLEVKKITGFGKGRVKVEICEKKMNLK